MTDFDRWSERLWSAQKLGSEVYLHGDPKPTRNQVAAVLHSLADHTMNTHMIVAARSLGADRSELGIEFVMATGIGRFLQGMGNAIEDVPEPMDT